MTSVGRNDPCPCGSGKKYKQCCLAKAEEERRERLSQQRAEASRDEKSPSAPSPAEDFPFVLEAVDEEDFSEEDFFEEDFSDDEYFGEGGEGDDIADYDEGKLAESAWWRDFEEADYEDRFELFLEALDDPGVLDDELTFEALSTIYEDSAERHERHRFDALAAALQARRPELYEESAIFYLDWSIANALISGNSEAAAAMAIALAERAEERIEVLSGMLDRLAYYAELPAMLKTLRAAWPTLKESRIIDADTIDELKDLAVNCVIFDYLERAPEPDAHDPTLVEALRYFSEVPPRVSGGLSPGPFREDPESPIPRRFHSRWRPEEGTPGGGVIQTSAVSSLHRISELPAHGAQCTLDQGPPRPHPMVFLFVVAL